MSTVEELENKIIEIQKEHESRLRSKDNNFLIACAVSLIFLALFYGYTSRQQATDHYLVQHRCKALVRDSEGYYHWNGVMAKLPGEVYVCDDDERMVSF